MKRFKTRDGAEWPVEVNVLTVKRCKDETGLTLTDLFSTEEALAKFFADDVTFALVLAAVIRPALTAAGKTTEDFLSVVDGSVIEEAAKALLEEVAGFFQEPRRGLLLKLLARWTEAADRVQSESIVEVQKRLDEVDIESLIRSQSAPTSSVSS